MIPYGKQTLTEDDINAVVETLRSSHLTQGAQVPAFENALAGYVNATFAIATSSATAALHLACLSLNLTKNDTAWTVPLTFAASANAIRYCDATVDFVDIDLATGCICTKALAKKLTESAKVGKLPKAIIVVHYAGISCDMKTIASLCAPYNIKIIEDASHAIGGSYQGNKIGCCEYSDLSVFSFHPVKIITSGEGGMITTNNEQLAEKLRLLSSHGITKQADKLNKAEPDGWYYEQQTLGFNYRMSDIHAALGLSQLSKLDDFVRTRNQQADIYRQAFVSLPVEILIPDDGDYCSWHIFVIRLKEEASIERKALYDSLIKNGIGCQVHYIPVHTHPYYQDLGFNWGDFPQAEAFYQNCLTIPLFPLLAEQQQEVITLLKSLLQ